MMMAIMVIIRATILPVTMVIMAVVVTITITIIVTTGIIATGTPGIADPMLVAGPAVPSPPEGLTLIFTEIKEATAVAERKLQEAEVITVYKAGARVAHRNVLTVHLLPEVILHPHLPAEEAAA